MLPPRLAPLIACLALLAACSTTATPDATTATANGTTATPAPPSGSTLGPTAGSDLSADYVCGTIEMSEGQLDQAPPATQLDATADDALHGVEVPPIDVDDGWRAITATSERLALLRELDASDEPAGRATHDMLTVGWFPDINDEGPGWHLDEVGRCTLRRQLPAGLGAADLALDPDRPLDPTSTQLNLVAIEQACSSMQVATDRIEVVVQEITADAVELLVGIRRVEGEAACASNPPTPFTVDLGQPLADRVPVDIGLKPPSPIPPASELDDFPD